MNDSRTPPTGGIVRAPRPADRFAQISNAALGDERLSFRARGILAFLLSRPVGWRTDATTLARGAREGRDAIRTALAELEVTGYLHRVRERGDGGRWVHTSYVTDAPETDFQAPDNQAPDFQAISTRRGPKKDSSSPFVDDLTTRAGGGR